MAVEDVTCPECGGKMKARVSKHGAFWGCAAYPKCKGTRNADGQSKGERSPGSSEHEEPDDTRLPSERRGGSRRYQ